MSSVQVVGGSKTALVVDCLSDVAAWIATASSRDLSPSWARVMRATMDPVGPLDAPPPRAAARRRTEDLVLAELARQRERRGCAIVVISHHLALVARLAEPLLVMRGGRVIDGGAMSAGPSRRLRRRSRCADSLPGIAAGVASRSPLTTSHSRCPPGSAWRSSAHRGRARRRSRAASPAFDELRRTLGLAVVLISHDLGVVARIADRLLVLDCGTVCEQGPVAVRCHEVTRQLVTASTSLAAVLDASR